MLELNEVLAEHTDLRAHGFNNGAEPPSLRGFDLAKTFLNGCTRTEDTDYGHSSAGWKGIAERSVGSYISTGEFIAAAIALGYKLERCEPTRRDPNPFDCYFNIKYFKERF